MKIKTHQSRRRVERNQTDREILAATKLTKVRRVVGDQNIASVDGTPGHPMTSRAGKPEPAHMAGFRIPAVPRELRKIRAQTFVDQELHEAGRSSRATARDDFAGAARQICFVGGRPRRG